MNLAIPVNPVLARELKERMRGRRAAVVVTIYLVILGGILYIVYQGQAGDSVDVFGGPVATQVATVGRSIFEWLVFFMMLLVLFLVPGLTAGAIAGERERQTLVPLQVTLLRPRSIVLGKIGASIAFLALLVVATLPLLSVSYLIGGVSIAQVLQAVATVLATGLVLACVTVACSTFVRRVQSATVVAYGITLAMALGTFLAYGAAALIDQSRGIDAANPPVEILIANPLVAAADVIGGDDGSSGGPGSPFDPIHELLRRDDVVTFEGRAINVDDSGARVVFGNAVGTVVIDNEDAGLAPPPPVPVPLGRPDGFDQFGNPVFGQADEGVPFWLKSYGVLGVLSVLLLVAATRRLRTPSAEER